MKLWMEVGWMTLLSAPPALMFLQVMISTNGKLQLLSKLVTLKLRSKLATVAVVCPCPFVSSPGAFCIFDFLCGVGVREWLSVDSKRVARWGKYTERNSNADIQSVSKTHGINVSAEAEMVMEEESYTWRPSVKVGDLIDALTITNHWVEACVLDIVKIPVVGDSCAMEVNDVDMGSAGAGNAAHVSAKDLNAGNVVRNECDTKRRYVDKDAAHSASEIGYSVSVSGMNEEVAAEHMGVMDVPTAPLTPVEPVQLTDNCVGAKTMVLVSFLGCPERCDEWVDLNGPRVAFIRSRSMGRHEDTNPIRPEIKEMMNLYRANAHAEKNDFAVARFGSVYPACYVEIVQKFGVHNGFATCLQLLRDLSSPDVAQNGEKSDFQNEHARPLLNSGLFLIQTLCKASVVYSQEFIIHLHQNKIFDDFRMFFRSLSTAELRDISMESMESTLFTIEVLCKSLVKCNMQVNCTKNSALDPFYEEISLEMAMNYLATPFLKCRLGGLKLLSDLFSRAEDAKKYPNGMKIMNSTRSSSALAHATKHTQVPLNSTEDCLPVESFRVVAILVHLTTKMLYDEVCNRNTIYSIFCGELAHESLMTRCKPMLSVVARDDLLSCDVMAMLFEGALKYEEALEVILGVIPFVKCSVNGAMVLFKVLDECVAKLVPDEYTVGIIDVVAAVIICCKMQLLKQCIKCIEQKDTSEGDVELEDLLINVTLKGLYLLWKCCKDDDLNSICTSSDVKSRCFLKLDECLRVDGDIHKLNECYCSIFGVDSSSQCSLYRKSLWSNVDLSLFMMSNLPSHRKYFISHWKRCEMLLGFVIECLKEERCEYSALRTLQIVVVSWPAILSLPSICVHTPDVDASILPTSLAQESIASEAPPERTRGAQSLPFICLSRSGFAGYIEKSCINILDATVKYVVKLKNYAVACVLPDASFPYVSPSELNELENCQYRNAFLCAAEQVLLENVVVPDCKFSYKDTLEKCLLFFKSYTRLSTKLQLNKVQVSDIWNCFVVFAAAPFEMIDGIEFISSLVCRNASSQTTSKREALCEVDTLQWAFEKLLCNPHLIGSPVFGDVSISSSQSVLVSDISTVYYTAIEKLFCWSNMRSKLLCSSLVGRHVTITVYCNPVDLVHLDIFIDIVSCTLSEEIAKKSIEFLTSLPSKVAVSVRDRMGTLNSYRSFLLDKCLRGLRLYARGYHDVFDNATGVVKLKRLLRMIDSLVSESSLLSRTRDIGSCGNEYAPEVETVLRPHCYLNRGKPVALKISCSSKVLGQYDGRIVNCRQFDTVGHMLNQIYSIVGVAASSSADCSMDDSNTNQPPLNGVVDLKMYFRGKEVMSIYSNESSFTTLDDLGVKCGFVEKIMVSIKPKASAATDDVISISSHKDALNKSDVALKLVNDGASATLDSSAEGVGVCQEKSASSGNVVNSSDYTCFSQLPVVQLSCIESNIELLFEIIEQVCDEEIVDAIWNIISRLPTSPILVRQLLVSGDKANLAASKSLYFLQIMQILLRRDSGNISGAQHAIQAPLSAADNIDLKCFVEQQIALLRMHGGGDEVRLRDDLFNWSDMYVASDGVAQISYMLRRTTSLLSEYLVGKNGEKVNSCGGISCSMFFHSVDLICKLLNSLTEEAVYTSVSPALANLVGDIIDRLKCDENIYDSTSREGNALEPEVIACESTYADSAISCVRKELRVELSLEWCTSTWESALILVSKLLNNGHMMLGSTSKITTKENIKTLVRSLNELLSLWINISVFCPSCLENCIMKENSCERKCFEEFLRGYLSKEPNSAAESEICLSSNRWFVRSLLAISDLSFVLRSGNGSASFRRYLFRSLLPLRPSMTFVSDENGGKLHKNLVFEILGNILAPSTSNGNCSENLIANANDLVEECDCVALANTIWSELREITDDSVMTVSFHATVLIGNIDLLSNVIVACGSELIVDVFSAEDIINVIMKKLLLLNIDSELVLDCVSVDQLSRAGLYKLLEVIVNTESTLLGNTVDSDKNEEMVYSSFRKDIHTSIIYKLSMYCKHLLESVQRPAGDNKDSIVFNYRPEDSNRSETGYVGIRNLGSTCYMNSLLQVLYMTPEFRQGILNAATPIEVESVEHPENLRENLVVQLQTMFLYLKHSWCKAFVPNDWVLAYKDETGTKPVNVKQQQDAQEFFQVLCDRLEISFAELHGLCHATSAPCLGTSVNSDTNSLPGFVFGGKICHQMFVDNGTGSTPEIPSSEADGMDVFEASEQIREYFENFVTLSVDVKGCCNGLEQSLSKFTAGERICDYTWKEGEPKVDIWKRQCIHQLPNNLIFHLKRFELNFDTFLREKVNDSFPFPFVLDMYPYTRHGVMSIEQESSEQKCLFDLYGIVVHTGTTDSGHYYSLVREVLNSCDESGAPLAAFGKWIMFNDSNVKYFDSENIPSECFGGNVDTNSFTSFEYDSHSNTKSAYMLIYRRRLIEECCVSVSNASSLSRQSRLISNIEKANNVLVLQTQVLNQHHISFMSKLLYAAHHSRTRCCEAFKKCVRDNSILRSEPLLFCDIFGVFVYFALHWVVSWSQKDYLRAISETLISVINNELEIYEFARESGSCAGRISALVSKDGVGATVTNCSIAGDASVNTPAIGLEERDSPILKTNSIASQANKVLSSTAASISSTFNNWRFLSKFSDRSVPDTRSTEELDQAEEHEDPDIAAAIAMSMEGSSGDAIAPPSESCLDTAGLGSQFELLMPLTERLMPIVLASMNDVWQAIMASDREVGHPVAGLVLSIFKMAVVSLKGECGSLHSIVFSNDNNSEVQTLKIDTFSTAPDSLVNAFAVVPPQPLNSGALISGACESAIDSEDAELAAAIAMSMGDAQSGAASMPSAGVSSPPIDTTAAEITAAPDANRVSDVVFDDLHTRSATARFLFEMTRDSRIRSIGENWRRSDIVLRLLLGIVRVDNPLVWFYCVKRQLIAQCVDLILGDQSPACGELYAKNSRCRAPTSYVSIAPYKDLTNPPLSIKNIPNWCDAVEIICFLACKCQNPCGIAFDMSTNQPLSLKQVPVMDNFSLMLVTSRTFHCTVMKQYRYCGMSYAKLIVHLSYENIEFSNMFAEILIESVTLATYDTLAHIFYCMNEFLSINDRLAINRVNLLFNQSFPNSILEILRQRKDNPVQHRFISVCIRSLLQIINQQRKVYSLLSTPVQKVPDWSAWMLQFCLQYESTLSSSGRTPVVRSGSDDGVQPNANDIERGPYIVVYGDEGTVSNYDTELSKIAYAHEISWKMRASDTYTLLSNTLMSMGIDSPESLLADGLFPNESTQSGFPRHFSDQSTVTAADPNYAMVHPAPPTGDYYDMPPLILRGNDNSLRDSTSCSGGDVTDGLRDDMTDAELEAYLAKFG